MNLSEDNPFGSSPAEAEVEVEGSLEVGRREAKAPPFHQEAKSHHMLSFSASKQESLGVSGDGSSPSPSLSSYRRLWEAQDLGHGVLSGAKRLFTPSQWMELQRQAMIFRYIDAEAPIPSHLLNPIGDAHNAAILSGYSLGSLRHIAYGWESFLLGSPTTKDADPERCRRTDGKKWRCANNAAPNHKYCEKHMNRGRHRSRKPVEGRNGRTKVVPSPEISGASRGGSSDSPTVSQQQTLNLQPIAADTLPTQIKRTKKENASERVADLPPTFSNPNRLSQVLATCGMKQENLFEECPSYRELIMSSLGNSDSTRRNSSLESMILTSTQQANCDQSQRDALYYHAGEEPKTDHNTRFAIPTISPEISSSSSSPAEEKEAHVALQEFDPTQMGKILENNKESSWTSASPAASYGGPLGEVFNRSHNNDSSNGSSPLNFLSDCWDSDTMARFVTNLSSVDDLWLLT